MGKVLVSDGDVITQRDETDAEITKRETMNANTQARRYKRYRVSGVLDDTTGKQTKTIYGSLGDQLDMLYKDIDAGKFGDDAKTSTWYLHIKSVKDSNPK